MTKDEIDGIRLRQQMRRSIGVSSSITVFDEELMNDTDALLLENDLLRALHGLRDGEMVPRIGGGLRAVNEWIEEEDRIRR